jgi:hypothetical protein
MTEEAQRTAARIAGALYLLLMITGIFAEFYARGSLIVPADAAQTAANIAASQRLFRLGVVSDLITFLGDAVLVWALYVVLNRVNRNVAILATIFRVIECAILGVVTLNDFLVLRFVSGVHYLQAFDTQQLQALARLFIGVHADGYAIGIVFFGFGSAVFSYLWLESRYIPRGLAVLGIFGSLLAAIISLIAMVFPVLLRFASPYFYAPIMIFEITLGFWLLVKGIETWKKPTRTHTSQAFSTS